MVSAMCLKTERDSKIHEKRGAERRESKWEACEDSHETLTLAEIGSVGPFTLHVCVHEAWGDSNNQPEALNQFVLGRRLESRPLDLLPFTRIASGYGLGRLRVSTKVRFKCESFFWNL